MLIGRIFYSIHKQASFTQVYCTDNSQSGLEILLILVRAAVQLFIQDGTGNQSHESLEILCLQGLANSDFVASLLGCIMCM